MSRVVDFIVILDDGVRKRRRHETSDGKVVHYRDAFLKGKENG